MVAGIYRESLADLGRTVVIDTGVGFTLVPWSSNLERQRRRRVWGLTQNDSGIARNFDRKRGWRSEPWTDDAGRGCQTWSTTAFAAR
jgi:hypothetical protein